MFCAEGLNAILNKVAEDGDIRGFYICRKGPKITHLFFAKDCILFCRANLAECEKLQQLLEWYEGTSSQQVNKNKTTLFFSRNTPIKTQQDIMVLLGVPVIKHYEIYLGLSSFVGRQKKTCFNQIKEQIWAKMQGWKE